MSAPFSQTLSQLRVNDVAAALHSTIENLCEEWNLLDNQYFLPHKKSKSSRCLIPQSEDYLNLQVDTDQLAHDRVSEERKSEYFQKLYSLLRRAPKESNLSSEISGCSLETTNYLSEKSLISRDLVTLPELDSGINISTTDINKTNFNNVPNRKVYTFHVYGTESPSLHQIIQLHQEHSLIDLKQSIYCVRNKLQPCEKEHDEEFFCIDNALFATHRTTSPGSSLFNIHNWLATQRLPRLSISRRSNDAFIPQPVTTASGISRNKRRSPADSAALAASLLNQIKVSPMMVEENRALEDHISSIGIPSSGTSQQAKRRRKEDQETSLTHPSSITTQPPVPTSTNISETSLKDLRQMETTQLGLCSFQCGEKYLFCHHGFCEHILILTDIHTYHPVVDGGEYPKEVFRASFKVRKCFVCNVLSTDYIVFEDRLAETNPCLYCRECFNMLHYDPRGQLLYDDFEVYPYLHDT